METEKIFTTDGGNSAFANGAMMGANLHGNNGFDAMAAMNQFNNPFAYMMFMALFMNGGWGNNRNGAANEQLQALQTQIADNHNSDLAMQAINGNQAAVNQLAQNLNLGIGQVTQAVSTVRDAVTAANGNIQLAAQQMISNNNLQSAALGTQIGAVGNDIQREILTQGYQGQLAAQQANYQNQIGNLQQSNLIQMLNQQMSQLVSNGFTQLGFQSERNACDVRNTSTLNTQKIVDTLNQHWNTEQQTEIAQLKAQISQLNQTQQLLAAINSGAAATATKTA